MAQALRAPGDPAWVADGVVSEKWLPVSPVTGRLDAFEWKAPYGQVEGPVEDVGIDDALASLPAISKPEVREKIIEVPVVVKATPEETKPASTNATTVASTQTAESKVANIPSETAPKKDEPVPFFGGLPDDPGVKKAGSEPDAKTRLKLF